MLLKGVLVRDWMSSPVVSVSPDILVGDAHKIMKEKDIRRLPVVKDGQLLGIVTLGDIRQASPSGATTLSVWEINYLWAQLTVEKVMTPHLITIHAEDSVVDAAQLMLEYKIGGLPVLNTDGELVGILTESDIFKMVIHAFSQLSVPIH